MIEVLVIQDKAEPLPALEAALQSCLHGVDLGFSYGDMSLAGVENQRPNLVLMPLDKRGPDTVADIERLSTHYAPIEILILVPEDSISIDLAEGLRKAGAGEVMTQAQMATELGKRLLDRMVGLVAQAKAEYQVEKTEALFQGIIEHASDMVTLLAADGTIIYESPSFERQLGFAAWEVLGQDAFEFIHPDDTAAVKEVFDSLVKGDFDISPVVEFRFRNKENKWRTLAAVATNQLENEAVQAIVVNSRDISKQKATELELQNYRQHLEELVVQRTREVEEVTKRADAVLAASPDALIAISNDARISFVSEHWKKAYPKTAPSLVPGLEISECFRMLSAETGIAEDDPRFKEMQPWWENPVGQKEFRLDNGVWLRVLAKKMPDGSGTVVTTTNITDYKQQQALLAAQSEEMATALEKERQVTDLQRRFVSMVSHEFRTPLTIIDGNAQILQRRGAMMPPEDIGKRSATIRSAVSRLVDMIEKILSARVLETGKIEITPEPTSLSGLLNTICEEQQEVTKKHEIISDIGDLPDEMNLDPKIMRQVFANILSNAMKYSPDKPLIELRAWTEEDKVKVSISDHGVGIPANEINKVFSRFFRASTSTGIPGSGIGLNLVKELVELHDGEVKVESKVGSGTCMTVILPAKGAADIKKAAD